MEKIANLFRSPFAVGLLLVGVGWGLAVYSSLIVGGYLATWLASGGSMSSQASGFSPPFWALGYVLGASFTGQNGIAFFVGLALSRFGALSLLGGGFGLGHKIILVPSIVNLLMYLILFASIWLSLSGS